MDVEEATSKKAELREAVNHWKEQNPDWEDTEPINFLRSKVEKGTYTGYKSVLPVFLFWEDKPPDQIMAERDANPLNIITRSLRFSSNNL